MKRLPALLVATILTGAFLFGWLPARVKPATVSAQSGGGFGPETFTRGENGKVRYTRTFSVTDTSIPYTLLVTHGERDGAARVKKGNLTLNGVQVLNFKKATGFYALAVRLQPQNELNIFMKGGVATGFLTIAIEPTRSTLLNSPDDGDFDDRQAGIDTPFSVSVDSANHRAYIAERGKDAVVEFDTEALRVTRMFDDVDSDAVSGNAGTSSVSINGNERTVVVSNPSDFTVPGVPPTNGSVSVINIGDGSTRTLSLDSQGEIHPFLVAVNANNNVAAFTSLYGARYKRASFIDLASGNVTSREEAVPLFAVTNNPVTNEFIFTGGDGTGRPMLFVYSAMAPFRRLKEINSSAAPGSVFERIAVNPTNNVAVAVNLKDGAIFLFDIAAGVELARLPIRVSSTQFPDADVAVNPQTNMAVVVTKDIALAYVVDLGTNLLRAELPLHPGISPNAVGIDTQLNRAIIAETSFAGNRHAGSVIALELPARQ